VDGRDDVGLGDVVGVREGRFEPFHVDVGKSLLETATAPRAITSGVRRRWVSRLQRYRVVAGSYVRIGSPDGPGGQ
jgi:hypothetical protein